MKKIIWIVYLFLSLVSTTVYASGGISHMLMAKEAINYITDPELRNLLLDNFETYLVGAYYPDSGYVKGANYGEDSHWDPFIFNFADYLKEKYKDPIKENPRLVAFLFGCASHKVSDIIIHWTFYSESKLHDFNGDWNLAHQYGDIGIDLIAVLEKNQWTQPTKWWIPVDDLVKVYQRMGKPYPASEIRWGTSVLFFAGFGERSIAVPSYPYLVLRMPWTAANYYNWAPGGFVTTERKVAEYQMNLWNRIRKNTAEPIPTEKIKQLDDMSDMPALKFAHSAVESGVVTIPSQENEDGSIELQEPIINEITQLNNLLKDFMADAIK